MIGIHRRTLYDLISILAIGGLAAFGWTAWQARDYLTHRFPTAKETVVKIVSSDPETWGHGSGVVIEGDGTILTNAHVADGVGENPIVVFNDGRRIPAKTLWKTDEVLDVALLRVLPPKPTTFSHASLRCSRVKVGEAVYLVGHPLSVEWAVTFGYISGHQPFRLVTDATVLPGNSGGGLFDSSDRLIGLPQGVSSFMLGMTGQSFAVSNQVLCMLLGK